MSDTTGTLQSVDPRNVPAVRAYDAVGFQHARGQMMRLRRVWR